MSETPATGPPVANPPASDPPDTRRAVLRVLRSGPQQAQEVAKAVDRDPSTVRRHLELLEGGGLVASSRHVEGPGRPKKRYALTEEGWETFPRTYATFALALLEAIERREGRDALLGHLEAMAKAVAHRVPRDLPPGDRLERVAELYTALGFEAHLEGDPGEGTARLVQLNCPVLRLARDDPAAFCERFDEGILRAVFPDGEVRLEGCLARGGGQCVHGVDLPPADPHP